jgi:thiamine pyrophosphate-dependent acetolactate synthase large subunit-like protein
MNRFDLTRRLVARLKKDEAVIGGIGNSNFDLWNAGKRPQNFYMLGSMGLAVPIALGVALAQPERRVFALEGDGSLLMQLGSLATIANLAPRNLIVVVWDNGLYQITGSQPTATAGRADLVEIARGAGLSRSAWARDEQDFESLVERALDGDGPWFIAARVDGSAPASQTPREPVIIKDAFTRAMAVKPRG